MKMRIIKTFEGWTMKNSSIGSNIEKGRKPKFLTHIAEPVEIRIDIETVGHAVTRQYRHGGSVSDSGKIEAGITEDEIIETIEKAVEEITIALMQDKFDIYQTEDNYPTKGVKAGEPNRFVIHNKKTNLNIVCQLTSGDDNFTLTVITVMKKDDFRTYRGQYTVNV